VTGVRAIATACALAAAVALGGCGSSKDEGDPIPQSVVSSLSQELTSVQNRVDFAQKNPNARAAAACDDLDSKSFPAIDSDLARIPDGVSQDVRSALNDSVNHLRELAHSACEQVLQDATDTNTETTETVPTETLPPETQTVPTETTPTETTTKPEKKPKPPKPPKPNNGNGNGGGAGGNGNGNGDQSGGAKPGGE
jgi:hypothetical protein